MPAAILVTPREPTQRLAALVERLKASGIKIRIVDDLRTAAQLALETPDKLPCVLVDLEAAGSEIEDRRAVTNTLHRTIAALPHAQPIAITSRSDAAMVLACIRAGAGDVLDLELEGTANAPALLQRVASRQHAAARDRHRADTLHAMIEDLLKDLIRTERRSIDLEEQIARASTGDRTPAILIVEAERLIADELAECLEDENIGTFAYVTGEDAVREVAGLVAAGTVFDLALVAAQLPGVDGLETIRQLREHCPTLPAFLVTAVEDTALAERAADLGVVGFVHKPLPDLGELVARLAQLARESLERSRERSYLDRIKARHERVLARYRSLPREP